MINSNYGSTVFNFNNSRFNIFRVKLLRSIDVLLNYNFKIVLLKTQQANIKLEPKEGRAPGAL
jgi:hypothetical protein